MERLRRRLCKSCLWLLSIDIGIEMQIVLKAFRIEQPLIPPLFKPLTVEKNYEDEDRILKKNWSRRLIQEDFFHYPAKLLFLSDDNE